MKPSIVIYNPRLRMKLREYKKTSDLEIAIYCLLGATSIIAILWTTLYFLQG